MKQTKYLLEELIGGLDLQNWSFVFAIGFMKHSYNMDQRIQCCEDCMPFLVQKGDLKNFFVGLEEHLQENSDPEGYRQLIRRILLNNFASSHQNPNAVADKIRQQGKCENILFWTPSQFNLMQLDYELNPRFKNVLFTSSFSTGKTEVMRAMMMKLMDKNRKCHFIVCHNNQEYPFIPLLYMQFETMFKSNKNFVISKVENNAKSLKEDLERLLKQIAKYPDHHTFIDEFVVKNLKNEGEAHSNLTWWSMVENDEERNDVEIALNTILTFTAVTSGKLLSS